MDWGTWRCMLEVWEAEVCLVVGAYRGAPPRLLAGRRSKWEDLGETGSSPPTTNACPSIMMVEGALVLGKEAVCEAGV